MRNANTYPVLNSECSITAAERAILHTIAYFQVFNYPLTARELFTYSNIPLVKFHAFKNALDGLISESLICESSGYYFPEGKFYSIAERKDKTERADKYWPAAARFSRLISRIPFVRGIAISGSLSKGQMAMDADIDYFIITEPGRLWLCRAMLVLYKKLFLFNSRKYFCINYIIDADNLEIPDRNQFTATEIAFLVPIYNKELLTKFTHANEWAKTYYPHVCQKYRGIQNSESSLKRMGERLLKGDMGNRLEKLSYSIFRGYWKRKFAHFSAGEFELGLRSRPNVSKHHPNGFQTKVLNAYEVLSAQLISLYEGKKEKIGR
ncbi:MAG: hypothetical protein M3Q97_04465 [Bacteroidota bacterium]|nr:hypothetical protein [Bacteroidota bacterium]